MENIKKQTLFKPYLYYKVTRVLGVASIFTVLFLATSVIFPFSNKTEDTLAATGTATESSIAVAVDRSSAFVDLTVIDAAGTFASSLSGEEASFSITTNNISGYTLSIISSDDDGTLINGDYLLSSISSSLSVADFDNANHNGEWGYKPSKYQSNNSILDNTGDDAVFLASPTTEATTLDVTSVPNQEANTYTIGIGARADYDTAPGIYTKTLTLTAVGNLVPYSISFNKNTEDTVTNMPTAQSASTHATSVLIPSTTPARAHYSFTGWCLGNTTTTDGVDSCTGTAFNPGDSYGIDQTTSNSVTLKAMWEIDTYTCTKEYRLQNADGGYPASYTVESSVTVPYGGSCSYSKSVDYYTTQSASATNISDTTRLSLSLPRTTYSLTINRNTTYIASVSGAGNTYRWGQSFTISATPTDSGEFTSWSHSSGTAGSFASTTSASTTYTMGKGNATIYADGQILSMQNLPADRCTTSGVTVRDTRDGELYLVKKLADGRCWLQDNLRLDLTSVSLANLTDKTNATNTILGYLKNGGGSSPYTSTAVRSITSGSGTYNTPIIVNSQKNTTATVLGQGSNKVGVYYNFCAASAGSYCYASGAGSGSASYDICPSGWRLPTGGSSGEYQVLYNTVGKSNFNSVFSTIYSGNYWAGNGGVHGINTFMYVWSSTYYSSSFMYSINVTVEGNYRIPDNDDRSRAITVRCILKQ